MNYNFYFFITSFMIIQNQLCMEEHYHPHNLIPINKFASLLTHTNKKEYPYIINGSIPSRKNSETIKTILEHASLHNSHFFTNPALTKNDLHPSTIKNYSNTLDQYENNIEKIQEIIREEDPIVFTYNFEEYYNNIRQAIQGINNADKSILIVPLFSNYFKSFFNDSSDSSMEYLTKIVNVLTTLYMNIKLFNTIFFIYFPEDLEKIDRKEKFNIQNEYTEFFDIFERQTPHSLIYLMNYDLNANKKLIKEHPALNLKSILIGIENQSPLNSQPKTLLFKKNPINTILQTCQSIKKIKTLIHEQNTPGKKHTTQKTLNDLFIKFILDTIVKKPVQSKEII